MGNLFSIAFTARRLKIPYFLNYLLLAWLNALFMKDFERMLTFLHKLLLKEFIQQFSSFKDFWKFSMIKICDLNKSKQIRRVVFIFKHTANENYVFQHALCALEEKSMSIMLLNMINEILYRSRY